MFQVEISAAVRNTSGKGPMRQLRMQGMTPGVVYGRGSEALKLQLDSKTLMAQLLEFYRKNTVVTLKVDNGQEKSVLIGEVQTDPVKDSLVHVDFCEIDLEKDRSFTVPILVQGKAKGVDLGGQLVIGCQQVVLEGKPLSIPNECTVDITPMAIGDTFKVADLKLPAGVRMTTNPESIVVSVVKPGEKAEEAPAKPAKGGKK